MSLPELLSAFQVQPLQAFQTNNYDLTWTKEWKCTATLGQVTHCALEEETVLQPTPMLQLMLFLQIQMKILLTITNEIIITIKHIDNKSIRHLHAQGHVDVSCQVHFIGCQLVQRFRLAEVVADELLVHVLHVHTYIHI